MHDSGVIDPKGHAHRDRGVGSHGYSNNDSNNSSIVDDSTIFFIRNISLRKIRLKLNNH